MSLGEMGFNVAKRLAVAFRFMCISWCSCLLVDVYGLCHENYLGQILAVFNDVLQFFTKVNPCLVNLH